MVLSGDPLRLSFRTDLVGIKLTEYESLVAKMSTVNLVQERDHVSWQLHKSGQFLTRSMHLHLIDQGFPFRRKLIWKLKVPLKIKIFLWYLSKGVILTKDNLARHNWHGSHKCCFCNSKETIQHLLFDCHHSKSIWRVVQVATGLTSPRSLGHLVGT